MNTVPVAAPEALPRSRCAQGAASSRPMHFDLLTTDPASNARAGVLHTAHGDIPTPVFMPGALTIRLLAWR